MSRQKKTGRDPRITTGAVGKRQYITMYIAIACVCGGCMLSYAAINDSFGARATALQSLFVSLSLLAYIVVISGLLMLMFALFRHTVVQHPVRILCESARKVAGGDYTVRIPPHRKDGKKDEFEVLFEDFNAMTEELASTEMLKNDFVSNVSHELKTPLAMIQNYATILQSEDLTEEERREYAGRINSATRHLSTMVANILQLSRLENQKIAAHRAPYNLSEQLARCMLGFEQKWEEKDLDLDTDLDESLVLNSDEELLDIVWNNLLSNAIKFTPQGGTVRVTAKAQAGRVAVTVTDTGCGIPPQAQHHIFDKFYQVDPSHATKGNGLGLAMVKRIVELLCGEIAVASTPGQGSSFTVTLPLGQA